MPTRAQVTTVMSPGRMRHRAALEEARNVRNASGGLTERWVLVRETWAAIEAMRESETILADRTVNGAWFRVTTRFSAADLAEGTQRRFRLGGRVLYPEGLPFDQDGRGRYLVYTCVERIQRVAE
jgi:SPP1 family predicted phage head-tail adaptor